MTGRESVLSVSSSLPKFEQTTPNERKYCSVVFVKAEAKANCELLGKAQIVDGGIKLPVAVKKVGEIQVESVYSIDDIVIAQKDVQAHEGYVILPLDQIRNAPGPHKVGLRLVGKGGVTLDTCPGAVAPGLEIPGVICASVTKKFDAKNRIRVSAHLTGNQKLVKELRWYLDGV